MNSEDQQEESSDQEAPVSIFLEEFTGYGKKEERFHFVLQTLKQNKRFLLDVLKAIREKGDTSDLVYDITADLVKCLRKVNKSSRNQVCKFLLKPMLNYCIRLDSHLTEVSGRFMIVPKHVEVIRNLFNIVDTEIVHDVISILEACYVGSGSYVVKLYDTGYWYSNLLRLGEFSLSDVYQGFSSLNGVKVAVKKITLHEDEDEVYVRECEEALKHEILMMRNLFSDKVVKIMKVLPVNNMRIVLSEMGEGSLVDMKNSGPISENEVKHLARELLKLTYFLMTKGINHKDIKPSNFVYSRDSLGIIRLKTVDFGWFKMRSEKNTNNNSWAESFNFMSYELIVKNKVKTKSMLYSVGLVLYYLLFDHFPMSELDGEDFTYHNISQGHRIIESSVSDPVLKDLLLRLIQKSRKRINWKDAMSHPVFSEEEIPHHDDIRNGLIEKLNENMQLLSILSGSDDIEKPTSFQNFIYGGTQNPDNQ